MYGYAYTIALSEAPNKYKIGFANKIPTAIKIIPPKQSMEKEVFIIIAAFSFSFIPLLIEKIGAPPLPNKLLNAVIIIIIGKHNPTAPKAVVPILGILAI